MEIINSVADLAKALAELGEPAPEHTRFFRGHGDKKWKLLPGIYREKLIIENEEKIIKDALTYCPDYFSSSNTLFEKLVLLQHYGYATRLLDLTSNVLVALYFASLPQRELLINKETKETTEINPEVDGEIIVLDIPNKSIKYDDSDTVAILSALSLRSKSFNINKFWNELVKNHQENDDTVKSFDLVSINTAISNYFEIRNEYKSNLNNLHDIVNLCNDIIKEKPYFTPNIEPLDFSKILCVRAKMNNPRILKQQGAFLLFGINNEKINPANFMSLDMKKIIVSHERKENILYELTSYGINKSSLFPELDMQAQDIMNKYKS